MYKISIILACLVYVGHGLHDSAAADTKEHLEARHRGLKPQAPPHMQRSSGMKQNPFKSLAMLLLTSKPAGFRVGSSTSANLRRLDLQRRHFVGRCSSPVSQSKETSTFEGAVNFQQKAYDVVSGLGRFLVRSPPDVETENVEFISNAISKIDKEVEKLEVDASSVPRLSTTEIMVLTGLVATATTSPFLLSHGVCEVLIPAMGATAAAVGFNAEYVGKAAAARGKEIAAITVEAAAEAEVYLAQGERAKAIIPLCVGISATAAAFALIAPELVEELAETGSSQVVQTEIYLISPLISIIAASVAALANQETEALSDLAVNVGARRFASSQDVGRTWLSVPELIQQDQLRGKSKYRDLLIGVLPAPFIGILFPGEFASKAIVAAAIAGVQAAISLALSEYALARAVNSVAVKTRCAGVTEAYSAQGVRASSILPYTSAIAGFCGASTVAIVEFLPYLHSLTLEAIGGAFFPCMGALIAAAASISKARCEYDAEAATAAATLLSEKPSEIDKDTPIENTKEVLEFTIKNAGKQFDKVFN